MTACVAVGTSSAPVTVTESWNGTAWAIQPTPNPNWTLSGVSCVSVTFCSAVGNNSNGSYLSHSPVADSWNGTQWAAQPIANPSPGTTLSAVSCVSTTFCIAVGQDSRQPSVTRWRPLAARWIGARWVIQATVKPRRGGALLGVSCVSANACTAVGSYDISRSPAVEDGTFAERWNGKRWTIQPTPNAHGWFQSALFSVSCESANTCTAVGSAFGTGNSSETLAERWNGKRWTIQPTPNRLAIQPTHNSTGFPNDSLSAVSCISTTACTAVGQYGVYLKDATLAKTLTERWNGKRWTIQPTPNPTAHSSLSGISCLPPTSCTAVGSFFGADGLGPMPMVESDSSSSAPSAVA
jgi:hypothetical protein